MAAVALHSILRYNLGAMALTDLVIQSQPIPHRLWILGWRERDSNPE